MYINTDNKFKEARNDFRTRYINWQPAHIKKCTVDHRSCDCPPEPEPTGLAKPVVQDYITQEAYPRNETLQHPYMDELPIYTTILGIKSSRIPLMPDREWHGPVREGLGSLSSIQLASFALAGTAAGESSRQVLVRGGVAFPGGPLPSYPAGGWGRPASSSL